MPRKRNWWLNLIRFLVSVQFQGWLQSIVTKVNDQHQLDILPYLMCYLNTNIQRQQLRGETYCSTGYNNSSHSNPIHCWNMEQFLERRSYGKGSSNGQAHHFAKIVKDILKWLKRTVADLKIVSQKASIFFEVRKKRTILTLPKENFCSGGENWEDS